MDAIQGKSETLGPCDEAPAVRCASVRKTPLLEVACDIWNLNWAQGPVGKCCLESE